MARKEIGTGWNRDNRNAMNDNFKELYTGMDTVAQKAIEEISGEFEAFKDKNDTHFKGVFATVAERDAAVTSPTHGDTATVADESTGISTTYRYVDATVDTSEKESGWKERDRWKNATAINNLNQQLADKLDKGNVSVGDIDKNKGKFDQTYMSDELLQQIAGTAPINAVPATRSITETQLALKSVSPDVTTFASRGKNLWDGKILSGYALSGAPGSPGVLGPSAGALSVLQKFDKGTTLTISRKTGTSDRFRVAVNAGEPQPYQQTMRYIASNDAGGDVTLTLQGEEDHVLIYVSTAAGNKFPDEFMIETGSVRTKYEPTGKVVINFSDKQELPLREKQVKTEHLGDNVVTPRNVSFLGPGKNLWNEKYVRDYSLTGSTDADGRFSTSSGQGVVVIQKLEPGKTYTVSKILNSTTRFRAATFKSYPQAGSSVSRFVNPFTNNSSFTVTMQPDENYLVIFVSLNENYKEPEEFMIEEGSQKTAYEPVGKVTMEFSSIQEFGDDNKKELYLTNVLTKNYDSDVPFTNPNTSTLIQEVYDIYDNLVNLYPNYVTRTLLGRDVVLSLPIYRYDFKPSLPKTSSSLTPPPFPKFIYNAGTHGFEKHAIWSTAKFFESMCLNWREDDFMEALRWNLHFIVIPCLNPSGYERNTRKNANGVDLNRNFTHGWGSGDTDPTSNYYRGPSASSEVETQIMERLVRENKDALFFVDHHNSGGWESQDFIIWTAANDENVRKMANGFNHFMEAKTKKDFPYVPEDKVLKQLGDPMGGSVSYNAHKEGVKSTLLETALLFETEQDTQKHNVDSVGNLIMTVIKNYS